MNDQTPGPLAVKGPHLWAQDHPGKPARAVALVAGPNRVDRHRERNANRTLFAASYTTFDRAGRELGIDAAELAQTVNIAALLRMVKVGRCNADARADMGPLDADMVRLLARLLD